MTPHDDISGSDFLTYKSHIGVKPEAYTKRMEIKPVVVEDPTNSKPKVIEFIKPNLDEPDSDDASTAGHSSTAGHGSSSGGAGSGGSGTGAAGASAGASAAAVVPVFMNRTIAHEFQMYFGNTSKAKPMKFLKYVIGCFYGARFGYAGNIVSIEGLKENFKTAEAFRIVCKYEWGFPDVLTENAIQYATGNKYLHVLLSILFGVLGIEEFNTYLLDTEDGRLVLHFEEPVWNQKFSKAFKWLLNSVVGPNETIKTSMVNLNGGRQISIGSLMVL
jgi:hypothetical protein